MMLEQNYWLESNKRIAYTLLIENSRTEFCTILMPVRGCQRARAMDPKFGLPRTRIRQVNVRATVMVSIVSVTINM